MNKGNVIKTIATIVIMLSSALMSQEAAAASRIKDIADFEGIRDNQLVGYGLVVGLNGTGDNIKSINFAKESLISLLDHVGINSRDGQLKSKNIAAVMVTANLPAFGRQGSRIDVIVSALGDAKSLQGGTLVATSLVGADGEVYAVDYGETSHVKDWVSASKIGMTLQIEVSPNDTGAERTFSIGLEAGNYFDRVEGVQAAE